MVTGDADGKLAALKQHVMGTGGDTVVLGTDRAILELEAKAGRAQAQLCDMSVAFIKLR